MAETYLGGKLRNLSTSKRKRLSGCGAVGKAVVVGIKDRESNRIAAKVVDSADNETLQQSVEDHAPDGALVYTDEVSAYEFLPHTDETLPRSTSE